MSGSAIATLILASAVLYGGLFITVRKAVKSRNKDEE